MRTVMVLLAGLLVCDWAPAATTIYWTGDQSYNWDTGTTNSNWSTSYAKAIDYGQRPQNGDTVVFYAMTPVRFSPSNVNFTGLTLGGMTFNRTGVSIIGQPFSLQGNANADSAGGAVTISNSITILPTGQYWPNNYPYWQGSFVLNGNTSGPLFVAGTTQITGTFTSAYVASGELQIGPHSGTLTSNSITLDTGGLRVDGANVVLTNGLVTYTAGVGVSVYNGSLKWQEYDTFTGSFYTQGNGDIIKDVDDQTQVQAWHWAHTGWTRIFQGSLVGVGSYGASNMMLFAGRDYEIRPGAYLELRSGDQSLRDVTGGGQVFLTGTARLLVNETQDCTIDAWISSTDGDPAQYLSKSGSGTLTLTKGVNGNVAAYAAGGVLSGSGFSRVDLEGGTYNGSAGIVGGSGGMIGAGSCTTLAASAVSKTGTGRFDFSGGYFDSLDIRQGTARVLDGCHSGQLDVDPGAVLETGTTPGLRYLVLNLTGQGEARINAGTLVVQNTGSSPTAFAGSITGVGNLEISGKTTLSGINTYAGTTFLQANTTRVTGGRAIPDGSAVTVGAGAKLDVGTAETIGSLASESTYDGAEVILSAALTCGGNDSSTTFRGVLSGTQTLTKDGVGTLTLAGSQPNTMSGSTFVNYGTLVLAKPTSIRAVGNVHIDAATLRLDSSGQFAATALAQFFDSNFELSGHSATLASVSLAGVSNLSMGGGSLAAPVTLYSDSQISGPGTLQDTVSTEANSTLDGTVGAIVFAGAVSGNATFLGNATFRSVLAPGNSIGIIHVENATFEPTATLIAEIGGATPGTGYDQLIVTGTAVLAGTLDVRLINGYTLQPDTEYKLITGHTTGRFTGVIGLPPKWFVAYRPDSVGLMHYVRFDFDEDGDVDSNDLDVFQLCDTGPAVAGPPTGCTQANFAAADSDGDRDVDQADFAAFQRCWSGTLPADPGCMG